MRAVALLAAEAFAFIAMTAALCGAVVALSVLI